MPIAPETSDYLAYLQRHARFFVLLTVVFGAITGVGIWWTIGLASPLATGMLIHTFVFGWAIEYVFFILEIVSAFVFYYYWGRLSPRIHTVIVWIYGLSAWISLVLITAITAFMLDPGNWLKDHDFWIARAQFADAAADRRPHRRGAAAQFALCLSARGHHDQRPWAARSDRIAFHAAGAARGADDHRRRGGLVLVSARLGQSRAGFGRRAQRARWR